MYINQPSVTKIKTADRVNLLDSARCRFKQGLNRTNLESLVNCLYPCPGIPHSTIVTKKALAFKQNLNIR